MPEQQGPLFNLKAVVQQTGLKPDTLRAWERHYGLPKPGRSEGGHRLYSQHNIETLKWLMARQRAIAQVGEGWYQGNVTVQQEHFCSGLVIRRLEALVMAAPPPSRPGRILLACPPQEQHGIGPLLLAFLLRWQGWEVVFLGANVPIRQLESTVELTMPQLVILAAQQLSTAGTLMEMARVFQQKKTPLAYGGLVFNLLPELRQRIPGHFLGERLEVAPQVVESLMTVPRPAPAPRAIPEAFQQTLQSFRSNQSLIEAQVTQALSSAGITHNHLALANRELGLNISAALVLGDVEFLGASIDWLLGLLRNYQLPSEALYGYLQAYHQAVRTQMGSSGQPIVAWLSERTSKYTP
jgi:hypothetical protein